MTNNPQQPSQATRLQLQLNLNTPTHQLPLQGNPQSRSPMSCQFLEQSNITLNRASNTREWRTEGPYLPQHTHTHTHFSIAKTKK